MADLVFFVNNVQVPPPNDWQGLEIECDFENNSPDASIKTTTFEWLGQNAAVMNSWFRGGLGSGVGIFEGLPFRIEACDGVIIFDGCINLTTPDTTFQCDIVKGSAIETNRIQFLNDRAESFTFAYLYSIASGSIFSTAGLTLSSVNGAFTGTQPGGTIFTGTAASGTVFGSGPHAGTGPLSQYVTGTIAGYPGYTFTVYLTGTISGGTFTGAGAIVGASTTSVPTPVPGVTSGGISRADFIAVPYVISTIPDYLQVGVLIITFIEMIKLIYDSIQTTIGYIQSAASSFPIVWMMAMYSALATLSIAYSLFLTVLTVNTLLMLINELIQPIKFKYGMRVRTLFERACAYLGLQFSSTILLNSPYKNAVIIPKKSAYFNFTTTPDQFLQNIFHSTSQRKMYDETYNPLAYGYYDGTFAQLIREMEDVFNAKIVIRNNVLYFERWDFWNNVAVFRMPNQSSEAPFDDPYGTNASELSSNYFVEYVTDSTDENTFNEYDGTSCQMTMKPNIVNNTKNVLLKGLTEKQLNYALAKRKESLTVVEEVVNKLLDGLNYYPGLGGPTVNINGQNYSAFGFQPWATLTFWDNFFGIKAVPALPPNVTNNRVGAMLLSQDMTGHQKFVVVEGTPKTWYRFDGTAIEAYNIDADNSRDDHMGYTDAYFLSRCFHAASWGVNTNTSSKPSTSTTLNVPATTYPNQYLTFKDKEIPLCCSDFKKLKDNNVITSWDDKPARLDSMRWNPFEEVARVDFRVKEVYTKNLSQTIIIDGNQT